MVTKFNVFEVTIFPDRFQVKKKQFFHNFLTIMLFGVFGVFISASVITCGNDLSFSFPFFPEIYSTVTMIVHMDSPFLSHCIWFT